MPERYSTPATVQAVFECRLGYNILVSYPFNRKGRSAVIIAFKRFLHPRPKCYLPVWRYLPVHWDGGGELDVGGRGARDVSRFCVSTFAGRACVFASCFRMVRAAVAPALPGLRQPRYSPP